MLECVSALLSGCVFVCIFVRRLLFPCLSRPIFNLEKKEVTQFSAVGWTTPPHVFVQVHPSVSQVVKILPTILTKFFVFFPHLRSDWVSTVVLYMVPHDPFYTLTASFEFCINCCSYRVSFFLLFFPVPVSVFTKSSGSRRVLFRLRSGDVCLAARAASLSSTVYCKTSLDVYNSSSADDPKGKCWCDWCDCSFLPGSPLAWCVPNKALCFAANP